MKEFGVIAHIYIYTRLFKLTSEEGLIRYCCEIHVTVTYIRMCVCIGQNADQQHDCLIISIVKLLLILCSWWNAERRKSAVSRLIDEEITQIRVVIMKNNMRNTEGYFCEKRLFGGHWQQVFKQINSIF